MQNLHFAGKFGAFWNKSCFSWTPGNFTILSRLNQDAEKTKQNHFRATEGKRYAARNSKRKRTDSHLANKKRIQPPKVPSITNHLRAKQAGKQVMKKR